VDAYPLVNKTADEAYACFVDFAGPRRRLSYVWTDNSQELIKALKDFGVTHGRSTPYRPETNGIAERMNRTVLERHPHAVSVRGFACRPSGRWP
jgi:transposase InsO family protein